MELQSNKVTNRVQLELTNENCMKTCKFTAKLIMYP